MTKKRQLKKNLKGEGGRVWFFENGATLRFAASRSGKTNIMFGSLLAQYGVPQNRIDEILEGEW